MILLLDVLIAFLDIVDLYTVFVPKPFQSFYISHLLMLHQKSDGIALLVATEAVEILPCRRYMETWSLFLMERAAGNIIGALPFQRDEVSDYLYDVYGIPDTSYCRLVYHRELLSVFDLLKSLADLGFNLLAEFRIVFEQLLYSLPALGQLGISVAEPASALFDDV